MTDGKPVEIKPAKGRPFLQWVGKQPLKHITAYPAQKVEVYTAGEPAAGGQPDLWQDWPAGYPRGGLLFHGDNKDVLAHLLANGFRGKVKLVYIDPPFDSGADYVRQVKLRKAESMLRLEAQNYSIGEQTQYSDIWVNDTYLQFMFERLLILKELLTEDGSIYLHCDHRKSHFLRCLMDEVFGASNYRNEIIWKRTTARSASGTYNHIHDTIFFYTRSDEFTWNKQYLPYSHEYKQSTFKKDGDGKLYRETPLTAPGTRTGQSGQPWRGVNPSLIGQGRHWAIPSFVRHLLSSSARNDPIRALEELEAIGRIKWAKDGEGRPNVIQYENDLEGVELQSIWTDFGALSSGSSEYEEYPTQKPEELIERILCSSSNPKDIVLDCFIGSGTTAATAQKLGRRWIAADINKGAVQTTAKRLQTIIQEQAALRSRQQLELPNIEREDDHPAPAQLSFAVYRVNDYDLQIQHNEALSLACEHLGVTRTKTDRFFDGTLGKRLVKVIPFNHPLTPLDLEEIRRELQSRPEEGRDVVVVSLGKELAADAWLEDWNRLRARGDAPNKIEAIELRTDPRVGGFFTHEPAQAEVAFRRESAGEVCVEITNFISPTILERLHRQSGVLSPQITDWRSMVDSVMIDPAYDGEVFNIALADVPEKKDALVAGVYRLSAPEDETAVAVKITDMLGEEVLVVARV